MRAAARFALRFAWPLVAPLLIGLLPAGCGPFNAAVGTVAGLDAAVAVPVFGRGTGDIVVSAIIGRDCSIVRLDQGKSYCALPEAPVPADEFCTRSLGVVDCWAYPGLLPNQPLPVGDKPTLSPAQEANRTERWPKL